MALPVMSVDTIKEAAHLQIFTCKLAYDNERFIISEASGFVRGDVETLDRAGEYLDSVYQQFLNRKKTK